MTADLFFYTETSRRPWVEQVARGAFTLRVTLPGNPTLAEIMAATNKGSGRSGVFEVHTDEGIYTHHNPAFVDRGYGRLHPDKAVFTPW